MLTAAGVAAGSYLLGSIPFSFLVARLFGVKDVRRVGSGNVGATNVLRTAGKLAGALAFLLDALKGGLVAVAAGTVAPDGPHWPALAAVAAVLGHMYPVWLGFRGGKGVATGLGAFLPLAPEAVLAAVIVFALVLAATRYVSLASISAVLALAGLAFALGAPTPTAWAIAFAAALVVFRHRGNLIRLLRGTESRAGRRGT